MLGIAQDVFVKAEEEILWLMTKDTHRRIVLAGFRACKVRSEEQEQ